jgi:hypothetical protein
VLRSFDTWLPLSHQLSSKLEAQMTTLTLAYLVYFIASGLIFWRLSTTTAILVCFFGGWLLLPVGNYPLVDDLEAFPWWITGLAIPSEVALNKAWVVSVCCTLFSVIFNGGKLRTFRPTVLDVLMVLWCLLPIGSEAIGNALNPSAVTTSLLLLGGWGLPWILGRIWFSTADAQLAFLKACAWSGVACLPLALVEGIGGYSVYTPLYGLHPFHADGFVRYFGFRPIGFFENGNQYGIWVCLSAFSAIWLVVSQRKIGSGNLAIWIALLCGTIAVLAQSIGAIMLLLAGLAVLMFWHNRGLMPLVLGGVGLLAVMAALHLSGILPLEYIARETKFGQMLIEGFRSIGRGSFLWRFSQDIKAMQVIDNALLLGTGEWDWWRPSGTRPWGLWLLVIGQFGLVGFVLSYGTLIASGLKAMLDSRGTSGWSPFNVALPMAIIVGLTLIDSLLNAFLYFPALIAAGAIVSRQVKGTS